MKTKWLISLECVQVVKQNRQVQTHNANSSNILKNKIHDPMALMFEIEWHSWRQTLVTLLQNKTN